MEDRAPFQHEHAPPPATTFGGFRKWLIVKLAGDDAVAVNLHIAASGVMPKNDRPMLVYGCTIVGAFLDRPIEAGINLEPPPPVNWFAEGAAFKEYPWGDAHG